MKRFVFALAMLALSATAGATPADLTTLKNYVAKALPRCPDSTLTVTRVEGGPAGFDVYQVKLTSSDQYCGTQKYLLYSPKSDQTVLGSVIPLSTDARPINVRVTEKASELLRKPHTATVSPFPLPDGLKAVSITRQTPYGPFAYHSFVDASGLFLIVGSRGSIQTDPAKTLRDAINMPAAVRRGNKDAKLEIIELSDFQCPSCGRAHKQLEPLIAKNLSRINYYRLDLPLFEQHEWSVPAAAAARAIQKLAPGKYWAYVDHVFQNQEQIEGMKFDVFIKNYVEDRDIDWAAFSKIYNSPAERAAILEQVGRAFDVGVTSTPTFIINGQMVGYGAEGKMVNQLINESLKKSAPSKAKPAASKKK